MEELRCLGSWKEGSTHYFLGKKITPLLVGARCMNYECMLFVPPLNLIYLASELHQRWPKDGSQSSSPAPSKVSSSTPSSWLHFSVCLSWWSEGGGLQSSIHFENPMHFRSEAGVHARSFATLPRKLDILHTEFWELNLQRGREGGGRHICCRNIFNAQLPSVIWTPRKGINLKRSSL